MAKKQQRPATARCARCGTVVPVQQARQVWARGGYQIRCNGCLTR